MLGGLQAVEFAAGEQLYAAGTPAEFFYLIEGGGLQLTTPAGRVVALAEGRCGEEAAPDAATYLCSVTATAPVSAIRIAHNALHELAATAPALHMQAWQSLMGYVSGEPFLTPLDSARKSREKEQPATFAEKAGWFSVIIVPPAIYF